jgi:hypothetical protein
MSIVEVYGEVGRSRTLRLICSETRTTASYVRENRDDAGKQNAEVSGNDVLESERKNQFRPNRQLPRHGARTNRSAIPHAEIPDKSTAKPPAWSDWRQCHSA